MRRLRNLLLSFVPQIPDLLALLRVATSSAPKDFIVAEDRRTGESSVDPGDI